MAHLSIEDVADYFLCRVDQDAGSVMTHLKLQKLCYYAQAWHLAWYGEPFFHEDFEAWVHGPANRRLFSKYRGYGFNAIPIPEHRNLPALAESERSTLDAVWEAYGVLDAKYLERLTHQDAPWLDARKGLDPTDPCTDVISKESMREYYSNLK